MSLQTEIIDIMKLYLHSISQRSYKHVIKFICIFEKLIQVYYAIHKKS